MYIQPLSVNPLETSYVTSKVVVDVGDVQFQKKVVQSDNCLYCD